MATPTEKWSSEQSAELANTIRKIRIQCEHTVEQGGAKEVIDRIERFQAKLCYIEAGIFAVSDIESAAHKALLAKINNPIWLR